MRALITLIVMFITSSFILNANNPHPRSYNGLWHNDYTGKTIEIQAYADGLNIKGLPTYRHWVWFERSSGNTYYDRYGNRIKIQGPYIRFYTHRRHGRLTFIQLQNDRPRPSAGHDGHKGRERHNEDDYYDQSYRNERYNDDDSYNDDRTYTKELNKAQSYSKPSYNDPEGTWQVQSPNKKVYITETRDGLKARFSDELKWYTYKLDTSSGNYISENGNRYIFENDRLLWIDKSGNRKFYMTKISEDFGE